MSIATLSVAPAIQPLNAADILVGGTVSTLIARVDKVELGFAGRMRCIARLSFGDLELVTNRDVLPVGLRDGDWARLRVLRMHNGEARLLRGTHIQPPAHEMAWLPTVRHHRVVQTQCLRNLLGRLEPLAQATFVVAMATPRMQSRFFMNLAAVDHHIYPGGLFDAAVSAAGRAFHAKHFDERERGIATLAALFFDIGKTREQGLSEDLRRRGAALVPHQSSPEVLASVCKRIAGFNPAFADDLLAQFATTALMTSRRDQARDGRIRRVVQQAVATSWQDEFPEDRRWPQSAQ